MYNDCAKSDKNCALVGLFLNHNVVDVANIYVQIQFLSRIYNLFFISTCKTLHNLHLHNRSMGFEY